MNLSALAAKLNMPNKDDLKKLTPEQIWRIDELLASLPEYGEIHLIVQHGELRYINKVESYKANDTKRS